MSGRQEAHELSEKELAQQHTLLAFHQGLILRPWEVDLVPAAPLARFLATIDAMRRTLNAARTRCELRIRELEADVERLLKGDKAREQAPMHDAEEA